MCVDFGNFKRLYACFHGLLDFGRICFIKLIFRIFCVKTTSVNVINIVFPFALTIKVILYVIGNFSDFKLVLIKCSTTHNCFRICETLSIISVFWSAARHRFPQLHRDSPTKLAHLLCDNPCSLNNTKATARQLTAWRYFDRSFIEQPKCRSHN